MANNESQAAVSTVDSSEEPATPKSLPIYDYEGVKHIDGFIPKSTLDDMKTFEVRDDDIFVISYPKSGKY